MAGMATNTRLSRDAANAALTAEVGSWEGVTMHEHRFGGVEFRLDRRELGHLHGHIADLPLPRRVRDELIAEGRARPHHVLPDSGWVTTPTSTTEEVASAIGLFELSYDRARAARRRTAR